MKYLRIRLELVDRPQLGKDEDKVLNTAIGEVLIKGDKDEVQDAVQRMASNGLEILLKDRA